MFLVNSSVHAESYETRRFNLLAIFGSECFFDRAAVLSATLMFNIWDIFTCFFFLSEFITVHFDCTLRFPSCSLYRFYIVAGGLNRDESNTIGIFKGPLRNSVNLGIIIMTQQLKQLTVLWSCLLPQRVYSADCNLSFCFLPFVLDEACNVLKEVPILCECAIIYLQI